jgi:hypothetical protein
MKHQDYRTIVLLALLLVGVAGVRAQNLLQNPDFDTWTDDSTPSLWKAEYRPKAGLLKNDQTPYPPFCLRIERRGDSTGNNNGAKQDSITVTPGQVYTVGCWLRVDTIPDGTIRYVSGRVLINWRDASGTSIRTTNPGYVTSSDWSYQTYTDTAPSNAAWAAVIARCYGRSSPRSLAGGLVYADNLTFFAGAGVEESPHRPVARTSLRAVPNPFGARVSLTYSGPGDDGLKLRVYDVTGQTVRELLPAGTGSREFTWDGRDGVGYEQPNGLYFAVLEQAGRQLAVARLLRLQ